MGVAEFDETGAFGVLGDARVKAHRAHFIKGPAGWTHKGLLWRRNDALAPAPSEVQAIRRVVSQFEFAAFV
jgi:hypothetical protein